ncbi:MAG: hypothetical protein IJN69_05370 [Oscillospiraceae bacterium]|nr:hypothetical protein [Oscillospiraceae bacterium]
MKRIIKTAFIFVFIVVFAAMTAFAEGTAAVSSCKITDDNSKVTVKVQAEAAIPTDDAVFYLFALPTYVDALDGQAPVASVPYSGAGEHTFTVDLNNNTPQSLLYSKFVVAVKAYGVYTPVTGGNFITNPEVLASSDVPLTEVDSKKGIHMTYSMVSDIEELGIDHGYMNVTFSEFISNEPTANSYVYNGKTYYFKDVIKDYDIRISNMTKAGIKVTVAFLNRYQSGYEYLLHPGAGYNASAMNYAINTSTQQGLEAVAAATHFLAERYNGTNEAYGKVDSWIVGNEVNDIIGYYYMGEAFTGKDKADAFVREYLQSFRVMYQAVKSAYSNADVYICLEHRWGTKDTDTDYGGKKFVDRFAEYARAQGDMDWGLSFHPYSFPMSDADILNDGIERIPDENGIKQETGQVKESFDSKYITMKNLHCLTDYFNRAELLNSDGKVRSIILGEQGYTSNSNITGQNEAKQAANIALAYYIAEMNEDIDAFILRGHKDEHEGSQYFKFGIWTQDNAGQPDQQKYAYNIYKYINTSDSLEYTEFAKDALNIDDWADAVKYWDEDKLKAMGERKETSLYSVSSVSDSKTIADSMVDEWEAGYNIFGIQNQGYHAYFEKGVAVLNSFAFYKDYQSIEKHFATPLDVADRPYLTFDLGFEAYSSDYANDDLEVQVRLYSGDDIFDATGIVNAGESYKVCLDLSDWDGRDSIDIIDVQLREYGKSQSFMGALKVYNLAAAASVSEQTALPAAEKAKTDFSSAELGFEKNHPVTGSKIEPEVTVKLNGNTLERYKDYDVIYHNNKDIGTAVIDVVGIGNYKGWKTAEFEIYDENAAPTPTPIPQPTPVPNKPVANPSSPNTPMYRLYNPYSGEHFYTGSIVECEILEVAGWQYEGVSWNAPKSGGSPVHRMYNPYSGDHHYTVNQAEVDFLVEAGWQYEGVAWNSASSDNIPLYRLWNPNADCGSHHYTGSKDEKAFLISVGWVDEGIGWYGMAQ